MACLTVLLGMSLGRERLFDWRYQNERYSVSTVCKGGGAMNAMYVFGGMLSLGLLVYLMIALLKAEWF
jgi:K+-transporting ATPase KdpF subunit